MKYVKGIISVLVIIALSISFAACGSRSADESKDVSKETATQSAAQNTQASTQPEAIKLKIWQPNPASKTTKSYAETPFAKELDKRLNVNVEYVSPPAGGGQAEIDAFNIMVASGDFPDIIMYNFRTYPGGPERAIKDGVTIKMDEIISEYMPNLQKYLESNPEVDRAVKTDSGKYWIVPFVRGDDYLMVYAGLYLRQDWLDDLGLQVPVTIDDWYAVLKAFKEKKNAPAPLTAGFSTSGSLFDFGAFSGAYGFMARAFYQDDNGKVVYGSLQPGVKEFLTEMRKWYSEELLDKNFAALDGKTLDANVMGGNSGASFGNTGSSIGRYMSAMKDSDPKFKLVAAPYPVLDRNDKPEFGHRDYAFSGNTSAVITSKCKNVEAAARFLDYGFSDEGHMFYNFGIEGTSYNIVDGYPAYTDLIMKNPDNLSPADAMARYIRASYGGPFVQDRRYMEQYAVLPEQKASIEIWSKTNVKNHILPLLTPSSFETSEFARLMSDIRTYDSEMYLKFIMGVEPLENFDKYQERLKELGIEKAIAIQQSAFDRFNDR